MPTVNGFNTGQGVLKYNWESLENYNTPDFDSSKTYTLNDYSMYNGKLYKYISAVSSSGEWDSSKWQAIVLSDEVKRLFQNDDNLSEDINNINDSIENIESEMVSNGIIANEFNINSNYSIGDYVFYNNQLYKFTSDHSAGAWDDTDVVVVTLSGEFKNVTNNINNLSSDLDETNSNLSDLNTEVIDVKSAIINETPVTLTLEQQKRYDVVNGVLNVLTGSNYNSYKSAIIDVNPGETYLYSGRVYNYANQYSLIAIDSDNTPLKYELNNTSDTTVTDYSFTIPDGASQLIIQSYMTTPMLKLYENAISDLTTKTEVLRADVDEITIDARAQEYNNVMRSISRLGLSSVAPHNSRAAFLAAYRFGFRILLCDLRFTQDGVPVLFHDRYINQNYRNVFYTGDGMVPRDSQITIESLTTAQVQGLEYRKTINGVLTSFPIMFLDEMCLLVKQLGTELYLECKAALTAAQAETAGNIVLKYGIAGKTSWTADRANYLSEVVTKIPTARVATMPSTINASQITELKGLLTGKNEIFMFSWNTVALTETIINLLIADNIPLEIGSIEGNEAILAYVSQGTPYRYVSGIESNTTIAGKAVLENVLA